MKEPDRRIGPPATHRLLENDDVVVWWMDVAPGDAQDYHYHHFDYVLYYTTDVLATTVDATTEHTTRWNARYDHASDLPDEAKRPGILTPARSLYFIPGTGFLSPGFVNIGETGMQAPLIEVKRKRRAEQEGVGFARTDALVGTAPRSGWVHLLENDRLRVFELTLAAGESDAGRAWGDTAIAVIEGGELEVESVDPAEPGAARASHATPRALLRDARSARSGRWLPATSWRRHRNVGSTRYRELAVELK